MERIDNKKAAQVWQRVTGSNHPAGNSQELLELITEEWADASTYLHLSRHFQGKESGVVRKLSEQEQAHTACLKGIYTLVTGSAPKVRTIAPLQEPPMQILRRCYGREMRCLAQYEARQNDPQYGHVFRSLAQQEQEHCHRILEIFGAITK
jgi:rubrerythrin